MQIVDYDTLITSTWNGKFPVTVQIIVDGKQETFEVDEATPEESRHLASEYTKRFMAPKRHSDKMGEVFGKDAEGRKYIFFWTETTFSGGAKSKNLVLESRFE